jgi:hypothetical protein
MTLASAFTAGFNSGAPDGVGTAIKGILDHARAVGLTRAQSLAQSEGANQNAILAEKREAIRGAEPVDQLIVGPGGRTQTVEQRRDAPRPITEPAQQQNIFQQAAEFKKAQQANRGGTESNFPNPQGENVIFANNGSQRIFSKDGGQTWIDVATGQPIQ